MTRRTLKTVGLFTFILVFAFTMAACDMVGDNPIGDTAGEVSDEEVGELEIAATLDLSELDEFEIADAGAQSVLFNRFTDFELEFYIEYKPDPDVNYTETISLDDEDIMEDNFGDEYSVTFTALQESDWDVSVTLKGTNVNTGENIDIATGETQATVIAGTKENVSIEIQQVEGDLDITVDIFPSEETGGELMENVNVKVLDLDGEEIAEMDFEYGEDQNLLVEGLFPDYYTIVVSWEGHGSTEEEIQARVIPGKVTDVPLTLYGTQLTVNAEWKAEPASPENVMVEQTEDGFTISWDSVYNADRYNILRKRTPYHHDGFKEVGTVEHEDGRLEFEYIVEKDELFDIAEYEFNVVAVREHEGKDYDLTSEPAGPVDEPVPVGE